MQAYSNNLPQVLDTHTHGSGQQRIRKMHQY